MIEFFYVRNEGLNGDRSFLKGPKKVGGGRDRRIIIDSNIERKNLLITQSQHTTIELFDL